MVSATSGAKISDLIGPIGGIVLGRGDNGQQLSDSTIREILRSALGSLQGARAQGTGHGGTIGTAVLIGKNGVSLTVPSVSTADGGQ
jgi:hypothetical protein